MIEADRGCADEIKSLKNELKVAILEKRAQAKEALEEGKDKAEKVVKKGWW